MANPTKNPFDSYYTKLKEDLDNGEESNCLNEDRRHNAAILKLMLERGGTINMLCGSFSIIRHSFYQKIADKYGECEAKGIKEQLANAFVSFFSNESNKLDLIVEKTENFLDDLIISKGHIYEALSTSRLELSSLSSNFLWRDQINHICLSKSLKMLRVETDKNHHCGIFSVNQDELIEEAESSISEIKKLTENMTLK